MQTKLRILRIFSLLFVVSLLWTSPMSAAIAKANIVVKASHAPKPHYVGVASWYGADRQGRKMANGKNFDRRALTAACWYYPLGTVVRVVNLNNGNAVTVTITDRGPNLRLHRMVDLSEAAAQQLGYIDEGLTHVFVTPVAKVRPEHAEIDAHLVEPPSEGPLLASTGPARHAQLIPPAGPRVKPAGAARSNAGISMQSTHFFGVPGGARPVTVELCRAFPPRH